MDHVCIDDQILFPIDLMYYNIHVYLSHIYIQEKVLFDNKQENLIILIDIDHYHLVLIIVV